MLALAPFWCHIFPITDTNTRSTEIDSPNHSGNPCNGCLSPDIHLTDSWPVLWSHFVDICYLTGMPDSISVRIVCWDGHVCYQSSSLWLLLIIVAFVGNGDSKHVRGEQDSYEGLQYTLSNFRELDVVADYTAGQFAFWRDCHLGCRTIWTMCQKMQPPVSSILEEHQENYIS